MSRDASASVERLPYLTACGRRLRQRVFEFTATFAACIVITFSNGIGAAAAVDQPERAPSALYSEYAVKAAFLYNFAKFTEWPAEADQQPSGPVRLCILGQDPFGNALESIEGKRVRGRRVAIVRLRRVEDAGPCHVLFISASEEDRLDQILARLDKRPILTVTELPNHAQSRGIINLRTVAQQVRFKINADVAQVAGLTLSSKLRALSETRTSRAKAFQAETAPNG